MSWRWWLATAWMAAVVVVYLRILAGAVSG
jgi:hypothetical protein